MARTALNKSSLKRERDQLRMFERFLPALDLKRQQLMLESKKARGIHADTRREIDALLRSLGEWMAFLADRRVELHGLVEVANVEIRTENLLGTELPALRDFQLRTAPFPFAAAPVWVDAYLDGITRMVRLRLREQIEAERVRRLEEAVRRMTKRVNLFEKRLIPQARENIRRIQIYLSDYERAAVVRAKIAKAKQAER